jgi:hypothetical protein
MERAGWQTWYISSNSASEWCFRDNHSLFLPDKNICLVFLYAATLQAIPYVEVLLVNKVATLAATVNLNQLANYAWQDEAG